MGDGLFSSWRYARDGSSNPEFVLNRPEFDGAQILIAGRNFGSGSTANMLCGRLPNMALPA